MTSAYSLARAPARPRGERTYDVCVFGCTGDAGKAVAYHLIRSVAKANASEAKDGSGGSSPPKIRVGLAGRNRDKVERILGEIALPGAASPGVVVADADDYPTVLSMAKSSSVLVCCAGPYGRYGEAAVRACVEAGTHYVDITGEVSWVARMAAEYGSRAEGAGVSLLSFAGYDCVPSELPMYLAGRALEEKRKGAKLSTLDLAFHSKWKGLPHGTMETLLDAVEGKVPKRKDGDSHFVPSEYKAAFKAGLSPVGFVLPKWSSHVSSFTAPNFMAVINVPVLCRSASTFGFIRPDLAISDRALLVAPPSALNLYGFVSWAMFILFLGFGGFVMLLPPVRWYMRSKLKTYSFSGNLEGTTSVRARGTSSGGKGEGASIVDVEMTVPGDPGIYATGVFAAAVSMALLEAMTTTEGEAKEGPLAGFHPPVAALSGCGNGLLVKHLRNLGAKVKVTTRLSSNGETEEMDAGKL